MTHAPAIPRILRQDVGSTFSDLWYRVAHSRPRLSPHARIIRQRFGPQVSHVVEDPASGHYYRLSQSAYFFLALLDGSRSVDQAWNACNAQLGDDAPTQRECIDVLARVQLYGLLIGELPLAPDMVLQRKRQARSTRLLRRTGRGMFFSLPLWNPEPMLRRYEHVFRPLYTRWGAGAWVLMVGAALLAIGANWERFALQLDLGALLGIRNLIWLAVVFLALRLIHELGHATACKAMGGRSTEIGLLLIGWVLPLPYCDATSAWRFPETWRRVLVSAAGMLVETFFAAIAAIIWVYSEPGLLNTLCYNIMLISGVSTLLFNLNPLLRYDGYYILSDITGIPNLSHRSREMWTFMVERGLFNVRAHARPPAVRGRAEMTILLVYGALAIPYRMFIALAILLLISSKYLTIGIVLAAVLAVAWLVWPVLKGVGYLLGSPKLIGRRGRALGIVGSALAAAMLLLAVIPVPAAAYASGTLEPLRHDGVRTLQSGFVREVRVGAGDLVNRGDVMLVLENSEVRSAAAVARARLARARAELDEAMTRSPTERGVARARLGHFETALRRALRDVEELSVIAPVSGRIISPGGTTVDLANLEGRFLTRGALVALVASTDELVIRATVSDKEHAYIFRHDDDDRFPRPAVRLRGFAGTVLPARITLHAVAGGRDLVNPALSTVAGGDVLPDPSDHEGRRTLVPQFIVELIPDRLPEGVQPGQRARIRFGVRPEPMASQWGRRIRQFFSARFSV